jgi:hypothetical protein
VVAILVGIVVGTMLLATSGADERTGSGSGHGADDGTEMTDHEGSGGDHSGNDDPGRDHSGGDHAGDGSGHGAG